MRECEEKLRSMHSVESRDWISRVAYSLQVAKRVTRVKHAGELKSHASCCTTRQKSQVGQAVSSWLSPVARPSRQTTLLWEKLTFRIPNTHQYKYPIYPRIVVSFEREFWERNPSENKFDSLTIFILWFSKFFYSQLLHWYIFEKVH